MALGLVLEQADGLAAPPGSRVYARLAFAGETHCASARDAAARVQWDRRAEFPLRAHTDRLAVVCYQQGSKKGEADVFLGGAQLDVLGEEGQEGQRWLSLRLSGITAADADRARGAPATPGGDLGTVRLAWRFLTGDDLVARARAKAKAFTILRVGVAAGAGLPLRLSDTLRRPEPFVKLQYGAVEATTHCGRGLPDPQWGQEFDLDVGDPQARLVVSVWDRDQFGTCAFMGEAELDPAVVDGASGERWLPLGPRAGSAEDQRLLQRIDSFGRVRVYWEYRSDADVRERRKEKLRRFSRVRVAVLGCRRLPQRPDSAEAPTPYARVQLGARAEVTRAVRQQTACEWRQAFVLPLERASDALQVRFASFRFGGNTATTAPPSPPPPLPS